ncbi:hypothetical protein T4B_673, partial [Trichinella pseudospiralis]
LKFSRKGFFHKYGHNGHYSIRNNFPNTMRVFRLFHVT